MTISAAQCRGARGMLGWSQEELAEAAKVSRSTVADFERGTRIPHPSNLTALEEALRKGGIDFLEADAAAGEGARLALKKRGRTAARAKT